MAKTSTTSGTTTISGDGLTGASYTPPQFPLVNVNAPGGAPEEYTLAVGDNPVTPPVGSIGAWIVPPGTSINAKVLSNASGTTGLPLTNEAVFISTTGLATLHINSSAIEVIEIAWV